MKIIRLKSILIKFVIIIVVIIILLQGSFQIFSKNIFIDNLAILSASIIFPESIEKYYYDKAKTVFKNFIKKESIIQEEKKVTLESITTKTINTKNGGKIQEFQDGKSKSTISFQNILMINQTKSHHLSLDKMFNQKPTLSIKKNDKPYILIFHTHTTESYQHYDLGWYPKNFQGHSLNSQENILRIGDVLCNILENAGFGVIHDRTIYDNPISEGTYERSSKKIEEYLKKYPTIQILLDIQRDVIQDVNRVKYKPTTILNGKKSAQIMIVTGCEEKEINNFSNWEKNLTFALHLYKETESKYPGLMRPLLFIPQKYNFYHSPNSIILKIGSDGNTINEAIISSELIGHSLVKLCNDYLK